MKFKLGLFMIGALALAGHAMGQLTDDAANYGDPNPAWETGANEGDGFGSWTLNASAGGHFLGTSTEGGGRTNDIDTAAQAFGMWNDDANQPTEAVRGFDTNVWGDGAVFSFDFSLRFDTGTRGVTLANAADEEIFFWTITPDGYAFPGGSASPTDWPGEREFGEILTFTFTQNGFNLDWEVVGIHPSSPDESGTIPFRVLNQFTVFNAAGQGGSGDDLFFNNLSVTNGTPFPLQFIDGEANPEVAGDYTYTLERLEGEGVTDEILLSSSDTNVVTVPASVDFGGGTNTLSFTGTVVSLTSGSAVIIASNTASGAWAPFEVDPQPPVLFIGGPFEVIEFGTEAYTLTRLGAVGDDIVFSSSDTNVLTVPAMESFAVDEDELTFDVDLVGYGFASIIASNAASGAWTDYGVTVTEPALFITGQAEVREGLVRTYTLSRVGLVSNTVSLTSSVPAVLAVPDTVNFPVGENIVTFQGNALSAGLTALGAVNGDASADPFEVTVYATPAGVYDEGSFYGGTWDDADNEGSGFGPWAFNHTANPGGDPASFAGVFIGDPAAAGISGMDLESFGFFANPIGSGANAEISRALSSPLSPGETFRFQLGLNFDSADENSNRGFNLLADTNQLINVNMGNSETLTVNGTNMFTEYGSQAVLLHFEYVADGSIRVWGTGRDGVEAFDETLAVPSGAPDNFSFYFNATVADADNRQMYFNRLQVIGEETTDGIPNSWWDFWGIPEIDRTAGVSFDGDPTTNEEEWIADTDPTDDTSTFGNAITVTPELDAGENTLTLMSGAPTSTDRRYDVYWTVDLTEAPQAWTPYGLNVPGNVDSNAVELVVTNDAPSRVYRTGVRLP